MTVTEIAQQPAGSGIDPETLVCPGCAEQVLCAPPSGWPDRAGKRPEFAHRDGSVLCPDGWGRVPEPVEAAGVRYALSEAGSRVLDEAGEVRS